MYPSDISDKEWKILESHVAQELIGWPRKRDIRAIINATRYIMRGSCQWKMLPKDFSCGRRYMAIFLSGVTIADWKKYMIH
ncbi:transposase [Wolbachia pipientis]|uniref:transposase n=1 Tax=Wolbachia pipientis TaxID=955 RepID=UPI0033650DDE